jgi:orotate phosphoribosyltransferase-like protein
MTRTNTPWRPSEYERARQLRETGLTWREVGEELGRSEGAMHCLLATLKASDWSALDMLADAQPRPRTVPKYTYRVWRPSELAKAREMRARGHTWVDVGAALTRQPEACAQYVATQNAKAAIVQVTGKRSAKYAALSEHERRIVDAMLNDGLGVRAIGEQVGRNWYVISTYKRARGLHGR